MENIQEWKIKDLKKYLKNKDIDLLKILKILNVLQLEYTIFRSKNSYYIIEVYELYFIIETNKKYKLVKI